MPTDDLPQKTLREWREGKFLTQGELAAKVGVDPHSISEWENGRKVPQFKNWRLLAEALGIQPKQILFAKDGSVAA